MKKNISEIYYKDGEYFEIEKLVSGTLIRLNFSKVGKINELSVEIDIDLLKSEAERIYLNDNSGFTYGNSDYMDKNFENFTYILCFDDPLYRVYYSKDNDKKYPIDNGWGEKLSVGEYFIKKLIE